MTTYSPDELPRVIYVPWGGEGIGFRGDQAAGLARSFGAALNLPVVVYTNQLNNADDVEVLRGWPVETLKSRKGPHGAHVSLYWAATDKLLVKRRPDADSGPIVVADWADEAMRGWAAVVGAVDFDTKVPVFRNTPNEALELLDEIADEGHNSWSGDSDRLLCRRPLDELKRQGWLHLEEARGYLIAKHRAGEAKIAGFDKLLAWHEHAGRR